MQGVRKSPIMNVGTYCRFMGIQTAISAFIDTYKLYEKVQIVSLGSGLDTSYFLRKKKELEKKSTDISGRGTKVKAVFFEIDFDAVNREKIKTIMNTERLLKLLPDPPTVDMSTGNSSLICSDYSIISGDLRAFNPTIISKLLRKDQGSLDKLASFDYKLPTLVLAECALIYLAPRDSNSIIDYFGGNYGFESEERSAKNRGPVVYFGYDHIEPFDRFGEQMIYNLGSIGIDLKSISTYHSVKSQQDRFLDPCRKWTFSRSVDLWQFYSTFVPVPEKSRMSKLEMLDELEELKILLSHYCFTLASLYDLPQNSELFKFSEKI
ncbi:Leucine carboxyl methyltransferase 1 [Smittium mucronatum]|uniref:Leucine carboxyl methyltransferase 1 n=1 Tax=Smittium mucronatum TaxID=133383 RepID=A0A1R0GUQ2_9FUNG|nr:Leucine carboxyl methyltransferase 1 [Smittium mucronatum]